VPVKNGKIAAPVITTNTNNPVARGLPGNACETQAMPIGKTGEQVAPTNK
jgi:hypothetical protein